MGWNSSLSNPTNLHAFHAPLKPNKGPAAPENESALDAFGKQIATAEANLKADGYNIAPSRVQAFTDL